MILQRHSATQQQSATDLRDGSSRLTKFLQTIPSFLRNCFVVWIAIVTLLVVIAPPFLTYACKIPIDSWNPLFFSLAMGLGALGAGVAYCFNKGKNKSDTDQTITKHSSAAKRGDIKQTVTENDDLKRNKTFKRVVLIGTILLLLLQILIVVGARFIAGWDVWVVADLSNTSQGEYFSRYPNQLFLHGMFVGIAQVLQAFGISNYYLVFICLSTLSVTACAPMSAYIAKRLAGCAVGYGVFAIVAVLCGLSPWIMVPYSDTFGMFFTVFILWCYVCLNTCSDCHDRSDYNDRNNLSKKIATNLRNLGQWFLIGLAAIIGYAIKPTVIFAFVAIVVVEVISFLLRRRQLKETEKAVRDELLISNTTNAVSAIAACIAACILGLVIAFGFTSWVKSSTYEVDENAAYSATHFLMMGANPASGGIFSMADIELSDSAATPEERSALNIAEFKKRVTDMSPAEVNTFLLKKLLTNFADGTFAWEVEGDFYIQIHGTNKAILDFYGISPDASFEDNVFAPIVQVLWLFILVGCTFIIARRRPLKAETVMAFALLMLSVFIMLFEARARYLFLYAPYFIILGTMGWYRIYAKIQLMRNSTFNS